MEIRITKKQDVVNDVPQEPTIISALVQMKSTGFEAPVHKDWYPLLHECCDGECNHDSCCGKIPDNCPKKGETN